jgi:hypothetical protein
MTRNRNLSADPALARRFDKKFEQHPRNLRITETTVARWSYGAKAYIEP